MVPLSPTVKLSLGSLADPTQTYFAAWNVRQWHNCRMAKPDRPNFSPIARVVFGLIAIVMIFALLRFFGVFSF